ncbi:MAG: hypothetical protein M4D80_26235 [Myxococcota bacterium]|nr:hypothetical protein [Myxococcota bacterium]
MKNIDSDTLEIITGGNLALTAATPAGRPSRGSSSSLQTALSGVTSALDSLKNQNKNGSIEQLLPVVLMAKWVQNR